MKNLVLVTLACCATAAARAYAAEPATGDSPAASVPATAADVESLRQQIQALTATVQTLQQQVKDQQTALEKNGSVTPPLPDNPEPQTAEASGSPVPATSPPPLFPTNDTSVVASAPPVNANGANTTAGAFPTTDGAVTTTSSSTFAGSSLTQPIQLTGGGNKNYMNISFDAMFAFAASSASNLDQIEVGKSPVKTPPKKI